MTPDSYIKVKSAFRLALDVPPEQWESFLCRYFGDESVLREHVRKLLESDITPVTAIDTPAVGLQFQLRTRSLSYTATRH